MSTKMTPELKKSWNTLIVKCWEDDKLKSSLIDDPNRVLQANGITIPSGVSFVVVENEPNRVHLVLPSKPSGDVSV